MHGRSLTRMFMVLFRAVRLIVVIILFVVIFFSVLHHFLASFNFLLVHMKGFSLVWMK